MPLILTIFLQDFSTLKLYKHLHFFWFWICRNLWTLPAGYRDLTILPRSGEKAISDCHI